MLQGESGGVAHYEQKFLDIACNIRQSEFTKIFDSEFTWL